MRRHSETLELSEPLGLLPDDAQEMRQLRDRIAALESENARLRHLEDTVRRNSRLFEALITKSKDGLLLVTPQMTFLKMVHSPLGNTDQALAGHSVLPLIHQDDREGFQKVFSHLLANPSEAVCYECRISSIDGQWHWMEVEMTDMLDDPDVQAIVFNSRNISQRKQYEETLRAAEWKSSGAPVDDDL